jgi:mersacidin/lichenicidin family type 2 lantibiotic
MAVDEVRDQKDPENRKTLTPEELASLPGDSGVTSEISEEDLSSISGGGIQISSLASSLAPTQSGHQVTVISLSGLASTQPPAPAPPSNSGPLGTGTPGNGLGTR